ncbi:MAG: hypothetical protein Q4C53_05065 [Clostridia bacterium]|nr:hypothetical protein [Clostridia bacterium]
MERNEKRGIPEALIAVIAGLILLAACGLFAFDRLNGGVPTETSPSSTPSATPFADESGSPMPVHCYYPDLRGSALLIVSSRGETVLIDTGFPDDAERLIAFAEEVGVEKIDLLFLTTPAQWASGGVSAISEHFPIGRFILSETHAERSEASEMIELLSGHGTTVDTVCADFVSTFSAVNNAELRLLSPYRADYGTGPDSALVLRLAYGTSELMYLSEAGALAERMMLKALPNRLLHADVLIAAETDAQETHLDKFFQTVSPERVVLRDVAGTGTGGLTKTGGKLGLNVTFADAPLHIVLDGVTATVLE